MKKILALILALAMMFALTACGGDKPADNGDDTTPAVKLEGVEAPVDILNKVWDAMPEKPMAMGGDTNNIVDNAPGKVDITNVDFLQANLVCNADCTAMIDDAASVIHAMNANSFTAAAYHLADTKNTDAFVKAMEESIKNNQWMCGFPEKLVIATVTDEYVVIAFGAMDLVDSFASNLKTSFDVTEEAVNAELI